MLTQLTTFAAGLESQRITVEVAGRPGEGGMKIVGLGDTSVKESEQRVRHALRSCGYRIPRGLSITVNLAPADVKKAGPRYDLAIALGCIAVSGAAALPEERIAKAAFLGELALDGTLRHVTGVLSSALACRTFDVHSIVVPVMNGAEAKLVSGVEVAPAGHLSEVVAFLMGEGLPRGVSHQRKKKRTEEVESDADFSEIRGQAHAKRALEIAAAGGHNVLMRGGPGSGKTLLAKAFRGILPPLTQEEAIEVTRIYSVANLLSAETPLIMERPFRSVHHTASGVSIVGGGSMPGPGEISLAHKGVLFFDELSEFPPSVLEVLRQPLEDRRITITRAAGSVTFPADFTFIAAMNPPSCSGRSLRHYLRRISPPLLDRIDLLVEVDAVPVEELERAPARDAEKSAAVRGRVTVARGHQRGRFSGTLITTNSQMQVRHIDRFCPLDETSRDLLRKATERLHLSARAYHRTIKVARTIADLEGTEGIKAPHVAEALQYRHAIEESE